MKRFYIIFLIVFFYSSLALAAFPVSPNVGDEWSERGVRYRWSGTSWVKQEYENRVNVNKYSSDLTDVGIGIALVAIGANKTTLIVDQTYSLADSVTIPSNVVLEVVNGGSFTIASTKTLTINGGLDAGMYQIFSGAGSVTGLKESYIEWFGSIPDGSTDNATAIQNAINATTDVVRCGEGSLGYAFASQITNPERVPFICGSDLVFTGSGEDAFVIGDIADVTPEDARYKSQLTSVYRIRRATADYTDVYAGLLFRNTRNMKANISVDKFYYGLALRAYDYAIAYNYFTLGKFDSNIVSIYLKNDTATGWVTQNIFQDGDLYFGSSFAGDVYGVYFDIDGYSMDNNTFYSNSFQITNSNASYKSYAIYATTTDLIHTATYNSFYGNRWEYSGSTAYLVGGDSAFRGNRLDFALAKGNEVFGFAAHALSQTQVENAMKDFNSFNYMPKMSVTQEGALAFNYTRTLYVPENIEGSFFIGDGGGNVTHTSGNQGYYNNVFGDLAGGAITTGYSNNCFGTNSCNKITTGYENVAIGQSALSQIDTESENTAVGRSSFSGLTGGTRNLGLGSYSCNQNQTGSYNLCIGTFTGNANISGSSNIFLGYRAGYSETGSNRLYIENSDSTSPLIYGEFDNDLLQINGQSIVSSLLDSTGDESALIINYEVNKASGNDNGILVNQTDTATPGASYFLKGVSNTVTKVLLDNAGRVYAYGGLNADIINGLSNNSTVSFMSRDFTTADVAIDALNGTDVTNSSGQFVGLQIMPTYNQTSTASATDLLINRTETAVGSGTQNLIDAQVGGVSKFSVDNGGRLLATASIDTAIIKADTIYSRNNDTTLIFQLRDFTVADIAIDALNGTDVTNSSGQFTGLQIRPTYNQTGTASATDLLINRTQTAVGSGTQRLIDAQVGSVSKFSVDNTGAIRNTSAIYTNTTNVNASTYDLLATDNILSVSYTGTGAVTSLTLPTAQCNGAEDNGRTITIKDSGGNAGANNITIDTEGAELIDGAATLVINANYQSVDLYCYSSNWYIK